MAMKPNSSCPSQGERFIEAARHLGADENEAAFKPKLALIARQKVKVEVPEPNPPKVER